MLKINRIQLSRPRTRDLLFSWVPALLWMVVIYYFSSLSTWTTIDGPPGFKALRKSAHVIEYSVLAVLIGHALWTTWLAMGNSPTRTLMARVWQVGLILTTLYAITDELHQSFVPRREFHLTDIIIDGLSATAALGIWYIVRARRRTSTSYRGGKLTNNNANSGDMYLTQPINAVTLEPIEVAPSSQTLEIGILTIGKPTLAMALSSLLLQDEQSIRIHIVDTAPSPIINRPEIQFALRLAADREITCTYEHLHDDNRAFSLGRRALMETLHGNNVCFLDDDVVMPSQALTRMLGYITAHPRYGWLAPNCKNVATRRTALAGREHYSPGGVFRQDKVVRNILLEYYETTVDVLDKQVAPRKVWEIAFLTELCPLLKRSIHVQDDNVVYHLDYNERPNWDLLQEDLVRSSREIAEKLVAKYKGVMRET